jgi:hypothetical protein
VGDAILATVFGAIASMFGGFSLGGANFLVVLISRERAKKRFAQPRPQPL